MRSRIGASNFSRNSLVGFSRPSEYLPQAFIMKHPPRDLNSSHPAKKGVTISFTCTNEVGTYVHHTRVEPKYPSSR